MFTSHRTRLVCWSLAFSLAMALPVNSVQDARAGGAGAAAESRPLDARYRGLVAPSKQVLVAAPLDGIVAKIPVKKGDVVKADTLLALMDNEIQRIVVVGAKLKADSQAAQRVAEVNLEHAKLELKRQQDLIKDGAGSSYELRQKEVIAKTREAELEKAKEESAIDRANYQLEEERLKRYDIKAPFAGTIEDIVAEQGASLARGDKMLVLANLDLLKARINLPVSLSRDKLQLGKAYRLVASGSVTGEVHGKLTFIRTTDDSGSETYYCEFDIENPGLKMPAGFSVDLVWPQ